MSGLIHLGKEGFWSLPHEVRRLLLRTFRPGRAQELALVRTRYLGGYDALKTIFVHIPKTAGISIGTALFGKAPSWHLSVRTLQLIYPRHVYRQYFKFAFVRNPWDRAFSAYSFLRAGGVEPKDEAWARTHLLEAESFSEFIIRWLNPKSAQSEIHFVPQVDFLRRSSRSPIEVDFVGRFEWLEKDFETVCARLGVNVRLPHRNPGPPRGPSDYREAYTDEAARVVAEVYSEDIRIFGYSFDGQAGLGP